MPIRVRAENGSILEFPDDATEEEIDSGVEEYLAAVAQKLKGTEALSEKFVPDNVGTGRTILDQSLQGATFGFADEVAGNIAAGGTKVADYLNRTFGGEGIGDVKDRTFTELRDEAIANQRSDLAAQFKENPKTAIGAQLTGALLTGGAGASTKGGKALVTSLSKGGKLARSAKTAAVGAASGAVTGAGTGEGEFTARLDDAAEGAVYGGAAGAVLPVAGTAVKHTFNGTKDAVKHVGKGVNNLIKSGKWKQPKITANVVQNLARDAYNDAAERGGVLTEKFTAKFVQKLDDFSPQTSAGKLLTGDNPTTKVIEKLKELDGQKITLEAAQEIDEALSDTIDGLLENGRLTKQGKKVLDIQNSFRDLIDSADANLVEGGKKGFDSLKEGRRLWSQAAKLRDIEKIITRAELTDNPASSIKTGFRTLLLNEKRLRGFSKAERALIKQAAESGKMSDALRVFGSRLNPIVALGGGGVPAAVATHASSGFFRKLASDIQINKAGRLADEIINNALGNGKTLPLPDGKVPLIGALGGGSTAGTLTN